MSDSSPHQELVDRVVEEFTERCRRGERPSVAEYVASYPQAAEELREVLPPVAWIEQLKPPPAPTFGGVDALDKIEQLGEYRIVREIGRGGMGVVYEAIQQSLGRRVALKIPPVHAMRDAKRLERFRIEAQAAARLHHTNIVPVFGLFRDDGLHYYVMQFIDGFGLDHLLLHLKGRGPRHRHDLSSHRMRADTTLFDARGSSPPSDDVAESRQAVLGTVQPTGLVYGSHEYWRRVAQIGVQAADALNYAHSQGTLHRDIKPANLLLDGQGTVWITDFGLARLRDQEGVTAAGDMLGTLQYMAPEMLKGEFGPAGDQYSLGVTLYELLTLDPPFRDVHPAQLVQRIEQHAVPSPRSRNPHIPRDLETIVLKAMAAEPGHRYLSASALGDDLSRYLNDRPILARRTSPLEHAWRWCRRNKALAAAGTVALVSLIVAALVGWWANAATTRALRAEAERRVEAEAATQRADQNVQLSLAALEDIFAAIAPPDSAAGRLGPPPGQGFPPPHSPGSPFAPPPGGPGGPRGPRPAGGPGLGGPPGAPPPEKEVEVLQAVLSFYERFASQNEADADPKLMLEAAQASRHAGEIQLRLGQSDKARQAYEQASALFHQLASRFPDQPEYIAQETQIELEQAARAVHDGDLKTARARLGQSISTLDRLVADYPGQREYCALLARAHRDLGALDEREGRLAPAEEHYRKTLELALRTIDGNTPNPGAAENVATAYDALVALLLKDHRDAEARKLLSESTSFVERTPHGPPGAQLLAAQYEKLATLTDDADAASKLREKAATVRRQAPFLPPPHLQGPPR